MKSFRGKKLLTKGTYLNITSAISNKLISSIILNGGKLKAFSPKSVEKNVFLHLLLNAVLEILARKVRKTIRIKGIQIEKRKKKVKVSLFVDHIRYFYNITGDKLT